MNLRSLLFFLVPLFIHAQQEPFLTNFRFQMSVINPAYAGAEAQNMISLNSRNQWVSLENSPKIQVMTFSSERKNNVGLGLSVISNNFYVERNTASYVDFSYKLKTSNDASLYLGIKAGATFYKANLLGLNSLNSAADPAQGAFSRVNPNVGIGMLFKTEGYWLSFSIPRIFSNGNENNLSTTSTDRVHTYLGGGTTINLADSFFFKPSVLIRNVTDLGLTADILGVISFKNIFDFGASYRTSNTLGLLSYFSIKDFLEIGYGYETPVESGLSALSVRTHEISLRFKFGASSEVEEIIEE